MNDLVLALVTNLVALLIELEADGETDATTYLNTDGDAIEIISDKAATIILQIEDTVTETLIVDGDLDEVAVNQLAAEGFVVSKLNDGETYSEDYDYVIKTRMGKLYFI